MKIMKQLGMVIGLLCSAVSLQGAAAAAAPVHVPQTYVIIHGTTRTGKEMFYLAQNRARTDFFFLRTGEGQTKEDLIKSMGINLMDGSFDRTATNGLGDTLHVFNVGKTKIYPKSPTPKIRMKWVSRDLTEDNLGGLIESGLGFLKGHDFSASNAELLYKAFNPQGFGSSHATDGSAGASCLNPRPWQNAKK